MRDHRDEDHRLIWFDPRMIRQMASSICIVCSSVGGAFILSYYTPTVGLGCRSGGYMVYIVISMFLFLAEMTCWGLRTCHVEYPRRARWISNHMPQDPVLMLLHHLGRTLNRTNTGNFTRAGRTQIKRLLECWECSMWTDHVDMLLRVVEVGNSIWLAYIVLAQTVGSYVNCDCISSVWGPGGGYTDFENVDFYRAHGILYHWAVGTSLSIAVLAVGLAYIVAEYCTQSHLATEDFDSACDGMRFTRRFKKYTYWLRLLLDLWDQIFTLALRVVRYPWQKATARGPTPIHKTLVWDWKVKPKKDRRRSSTLPLMEDDLRNERLSHDSQALEESEGERSENHTDDIRDGSLPGARGATLQLPTPTRSRYGSSRPPSPSSDTS